MPQPSIIAPRPLPLWLKAVGSVFALGHLLAIGFQALAASSGPWPTNFGVLEADPPMFAQRVHNVTSPYYLQPLRMTHNYHFQSNRIPAYAAYFEVQLKDELGNVMKSLKFPDDKATYWVRHRQAMLASWLAEDQPLQPRGSEKIAAPKKKLDEVEYWDMTEPGKRRLKKVPEHLAPRDAALMSPSAWSKMLATSYARYLCKEYGAKSAELVRYSRETVLPIVLFMPEPPTRESLIPLKSYFGENRREK